MKSEHVSVFDSTLQKTNELLNVLCDKFGLTDKHQAYEALRGVLHALRDRLPLETAVAFGAQLPMLVRGFYYDGWKPLEVPKKMGRSEFLAEVDEAFPAPVSFNLEDVVSGVVGVLALYLNAGEIEKIRKVLPKDIVALLV